MWLINRNYNYNSKTVQSGQVKFREIYDFIRWDQHDPVQDSFSSQFSQSSQDRVRVPIKPQAAEHPLQVVQLASLHSEPVITVLFLVG